MHPAPLLLLAGAALVAGCASVAPEDALSEATRHAARAGAPAPRLLDPAAQAAERERLLQQPLDDATAVRLALLTSPAAQALLADGWRAQVDTARSASWPRLGLGVERVRGDGVTQWTRTLSIGLAELVTLPLRRADAERRTQVQRLALARELLSLHARVRQQWVRAVAARQQASYREQVLDLAEAGAEMARRLQQVGNWSRLQRSREELFELDARAQLTRARAAAQAESEALVRLLGLDAAQARELRWPGHLDAPPPRAPVAQEIGEAALRERLDLQLAGAEWSAATGAPAWATLVDAELALHRERGSDGERARGTELELQLPLGAEAALRCDARDAAAHAAAQRLQQARIEAQSLLRERVAAVEAARAISRQYREQLLPLRQQITQDQLLRYNGMLGSVFTLLADARAQVDAVIGALDADRDHWLAQVALDAAILGVPAAGTTPQAVTAASTEPKGGH
ncbi:MAG: TolC family protein [Rubrivivax sp.]